MIIVSSLMNMVFNRQPDIRKRCFDLEDRLADKFQHANILPIPENFDDAAPRFIMQSKNGHSNLSVSLVNAQLVTEYDGEFPGNWDLCSAYIAERYTIVYNTIEDLIAANIKYIGLITQVLYRLDEGEFVNDIIIGAFNENIRKSSPNEVNFRLSYARQNRFYINMSFLKGISMNLPKNRGIELSDRDIGITIDVNDRYAANINAEYISSKEMIMETIGLTKNILSSTIDSFIKDGEIVL